LTSIDRIIISDLRVPARIGCEPGEQEFEQDLSFTARVRLKSSGAQSKDETVCYATLREMIIAITSEKPWSLLEELGESICSSVLEAFPAAAHIELQIKKFVFSDCDWAGVCLERETSS